jgi:hypothetical protein
MSKEAVTTRGFALAIKGHQTTVEVGELTDGSFSIVLITKRPDADDVRTGFRVGPKTFNLLHDAMFRAAHDPTVWKPLKRKPRNPKP